MSVEEIMEAHREYMRDFPETICPDWSMLFHDLSFMVATGAVEVIE